MVRDKKNSEKKGVWGQTGDLKYKGDPVSTDIFDRPLSWGPGKGLLRGGLIRDQEQGCGFPKQSSRFKGARGEKKKKKRKEKKEANPWIRR